MPIRLTAFCHVSTIPSPLHDASSIENALFGRDIDAFDALWRLSTLGRVGRNICFQLFCVNARIVRLCIRLGRDLVQQQLRHIPDAH